jgi:biotin carboxyl carrier protein
VIATLDTADLKSRVDAQVATLEESRAKETLARKNRENNQALLRQNFISQNAFDTTQSTYEAAAAGVRSAEAQVRIAEKALQDAVVRAPFAGVVSRRMVSVGEKVGIDSPMFTVVDLGRMEIEAPAPAAEIPSVKVGQLAHFRVDGFGERNFEGRIERINPAADPGSRSITLYVAIANRDGILKGGMFAKGQLILDKAPAAPVVPGRRGSRGGRADLCLHHRGRQDRAPPGDPRHAGGGIGRGPQRPREGRAGRARAHQRPQARRGRDPEDLGGRHQARGLGVSGKAPGMWITRTSISQPVFATMVMVFLCVLGLFRTTRCVSSACPTSPFPSSSSR